MKCEKCRDFFYHQPGNWDEGLCDHPKCPDSGWDRVRFRNEDCNKNTWPGIDEKTVLAALICAYVIISLGIEVLITIAGN